VAKAVVGTHANYAGIDPKKRTLSRFQKQANMAQSVPFLSWTFSPQTKDIYFTSVIQECIFLAVRYVTPWMQSPNTNQFTPKNLKRMPQDDDRAHETKDHPIQVYQLFIARATV